MKKYYFCAISGKSEGKKYAAALLFEKEKMFMAESALSNISKYIKVPQCKDAIYLDLMLAKAMANAVPEGIKAAAITINAWENGPISGSVIGCPHEESSSAEGELEKLDDDLWCCAYSTGPGFIINSDRITALKAQQIITTMKTLSIDPWEKFKTLVEENSIPACIYVTDGSGKKGFIFASGENGNIEIEI
jgi:hypothetical protein